MERINVCRACQFYGAGGKSRIPIPHTCQNERPNTKIIEDLIEKYKKVELKPCPFCGLEVRAHVEPSNDGTVIWVRIMHGPRVHCSVSFLTTDEDGVEGWNKRI